MTWPIRLLPERLRVRILAAQNDVRHLVAAIRGPRINGARVREATSTKPATRIEVRLAPPPMQSPVRAPSDAEISVVKFADSDVEVSVAPGQTILEAGLGAGVDLLYSCTLGGCGACMVHLLEGEVEYDDPDAICLTDQERAEGMCLACVARPRGRVIVES